jgi:hypothetical protein
MEGMPLTVNDSAIDICSTVTTLLPCWFIFFLPDRQYICNTFSVIESAKVRICQEFLNLSIVEKFRELRKLLRQNHKLTTLKLNA